MLCSLPVIELRARLVGCRVHRLLMARHFRCQFDHVYIRIPEVDRMNEPVIGDAARFDSARLSSSSNDFELHILH